MAFMNRIPLPSLLALITVASEVKAQPSPLILPLWEDKPPGFVADAGREKAFNEVTAMNVSVPSMTVYLPPREKTNGMAIVYCSGGSYEKVSHSSDAVGNADYFVSRNIALIVVKYRTRPPATELNAALDDARRAMRIVRHRAREWGIDPARIGMLGGSAGAHLVLRVTTGEHRGDANAADMIERESCRPAFVGLLCPWPGANKVEDFPVALMGKDFYKPGVEMIRQMVERKTIDQDDLDKLHISDDPAEVVDNITETVMKRFGLTYGAKVRRHWWLGE